MGVPALLMSAARRVAGLNAAEQLRAEQGRRGLPSDRSCRLRQDWADHLLRVEPPEPAQAVPGEWGEACGLPLRLP
jgi:hypothetical protein